MAGSFLAGLGKMLDAGAAYLQHVQFAERALGAAPRELPALLRTYAQGLSDASFTGLKMTLAYLASQTQDPQRRALLQGLAEKVEAARRGDAAPASNAQPAVSATGTPTADFETDLALVGGWHDELDDAGRARAVADHLAALNDAQRETFTTHVQRMVDNCTAQVKEHADGEDRAWGGSFEDRMAYGMARLRTGQRDPAFVRRQQELQGYLAFFEGVLAACRAPKAKAVDVAAIKSAVQAFVKSGQYPGGVEQMKADVMALAGRPEFDEVMAMLEALGANEGAQPALVIADHYKPGDGKLFELRWPLPFELPAPFAELDRTTQFHVLFGAWQQREVEAGYALNQGDSARALELFEECLERAEQIDVPELVARSHEGLARVAAKTNRRSDERLHLKAAVEARKA